MKFNTSDRTYKQFNYWLRGMLKEKKIKQDDVAYRLNISQQSVSQRLNGITEWSFKEIIIVYEMLGIEHEWIS